MPTLIGQVIEVDGGWWLVEGERDGELLLRSEEDPGRTMTLPAYRKKSVA